MKKGDIIYWSGWGGAVEVGRVTSIKPAPSGGYCNCIDGRGDRSSVQFDKIIPDVQGHVDQLIRKDVAAAERRVDVAGRDVEWAKEQLALAVQEFGRATEKLEKARSKTADDYIPKWNGG